MVDESIPPPGRPASPDPSGDSTRTHSGSGVEGGTIGSYRLLQKLGEGGMGEVWLAEQAAPIRRKVALKVIKAGMDTKQVVARFEAERQALALMDHPAIAHVFEAGATERGLPYFAMEYVKGEPITAYCDRHRLTNSERLVLFMQVCEGVQHAHQKGVIHRDLKPSNVLVAVQDDHPVPKIIDFGVAKAIAQRLTERTMFTELGVLIGTPEYMSPEQAEMTGIDVDTRTDVYALGIILYHLLVGVLPFDPAEMRKAGFDEIRRRIREVDPPRPSTRISTVGEVSTEAARNRRTDPGKLRSQLKGDLDWIMMKALEKDRVRRYGSPSEFAADVEHFLKNEPVLASPPSAAYLMRKFVRRHRVGVATGATVMAALIVGLGAALFGMRSAVQARDAESAARQIASDNERRAATEAAKSRAALNFVMEMFGAVDPVLARGHDITVAEVLDPAAAKVARAFVGDIEGEAVVRRVLGQAYAHLARYPDALRELERAWELRRSLDRPDDPQTLALLHDLGTTVLETGDVGRGRELLQRAWESRSAQLGEAHRDTLATLSVLAFAKQLDGDLDNAIADIRAVLRDQERTLGPDDRDTLESMCSLADMLSSAGQVDEALRVAHDAAGRASATLGADSNLALMASSIEAELLQTFSRHKEAAKLLEQVVEGKERLYGANHPETLVSLDLLARTLGNLGQDERAIALSRVVVNRAKQTLGERHTATLTYMNNLAQNLRHAGQLKEAEPIYRRVIALRREQAGEHAQETLIVVSNLGLLLMQRGAAGDALPLFREALEGMRGSLPPEHWMLGVAMLNLGRCQIALQDYSAAETTLSDAYALLKKALGPTHGRTLQVQTALAELYDAWGKPEKAQSWRAPR